MTQPRRPRPRTGARAAPAPPPAASRHASYGLTLPGMPTEPLAGTLVVIEGTDGAGRSTQIALLTEWLESQGFAVQTTGLRQSVLLAENIDDLLARNAVTRLTLALMYATDFFDQLEHVILPALRAGLVVLADRYVFTLITRAVVRGLSRAYMEGIYQLAIRPDITLWLNITPETAFSREFRKSQMISFWESGRDMYYTGDVFESFIQYQSRIRREFEGMAARQGFVTIDAEASVPAVNLALRQRIAALLGIRDVRYRPSSRFLQYWR